MSGYDTTWYVEPLSSHCNKVISDELPAEAAQKLWCSDGRKHELWECDWTLAERIWRDRDELQLRVVKIWRRRGLGKIEPAPNFSNLQKQARRKRLLTTKALRR